MRFLMALMTFVCLYTGQSLALAPKNAASVASTSPYSTTIENNRKWAVLFLDRADQKILKDSPRDPKHWRPLIARLKEIVQKAPISVTRGGLCAQEEKTIAFAPQSRSEFFGNIYFCNDMLENGLVSQMKFIQTIIHEASHIALDSDQINQSRLENECQSTRIEYMITGLADQKASPNSGYLDSCNFDTTY